MRVMLPIALAAVLVSPAAVSAQGSTRTPVAYNQTISANPFGLMFKWWNVEYERKLSDSQTFGVSGSRFDLGNGELDRGTIFYRYYPQQAALTGTYLGARVGVMRGGAPRSSHSALSGGVEIGYSWLLGPRRNVGLSIGAGVDRIHAEEMSFALPSIRLVNVGIAF